MKFHLKTDFPEQFQAGLSFKTKRGELEIESYNPERDLIKFKGYKLSRRRKKANELRPFCIRRSDP